MTRGTGEASQATLLTRIKSKLNAKARRESPDENGRQRHAVVLSQFYLPEPFLFPPAIAEGLSDRGFNVSVVTGYPNRPGGKLYPGYRQRFRHSEIINGIPVHRGPLFINHSRKASERIGNFLSFGVGALTATLDIKHADVVYVYATPATAGIPAQVWKILYGIPYVLHVQDLWPESVTDSGMMGQGKASRLASALMAPWLKRLYSGADGLIAISPGMKETLSDRGCEAESTSVVYNWADETTISPKAPESFSDSIIRFLYAGNLGPMQDLETVLSAATLVNDDPRFSLSIAGGGILEDGLKSQAKELTNTEMLGRLPRSEVSDLYQASDFQLVTLKDIPIFRITVPSKLQASLASGVPVITTVKGDVANLIREHKAGLVADPGDPASLARAFRKAMGMEASERAAMGRNARRLYESEMSKSTGLDSIAAILSSVSGGKSYSETFSRRSVAAGKEG